MSLFTPTASLHTAQSELARRTAGAHLSAALAVVLLVAGCTTTTGSATGGQRGSDQRGDGMDRDSNGGGY